MFWNDKSVDLRYRGFFDSDGKRTPQREKKIAQRLEAIEKSSSKWVGK